MSVGLCSSSDAVLRLLLPTKRCGPQGLDDLDRLNGVLRRCCSAESERPVLDEARRIVKCARSDDVKSPSHVFGYSLTCLILSSRGVSEPRWIRRRTSSPSECLRIAT